MFFKHIKPPPTHTKCMTVGVSSKFKHNVWGYRKFVFNPILRGIFTFMLKMKVNLGFIRFRYPLAGESIRILRLLFHLLFFSAGETGTAKPDSPSKIHQRSYTLIGYPDVNSAFYDLAAILTSSLRCAENYQEKRIPCVFLLHL